MAVADNLGAALSLSTKVAEMAGKVARVAEIQEILDEYDADCDQAEQEAATKSTTHSDCESDDAKCNDELALHDADVVTPRGEAIVTQLSFTVRPGQALMIIGRGGSGKSSCVRALRGLWALPRGRRSLPLESDLVVVPQRIHMVIGTLADQVTYPQFVPPEQRTVEFEAKLLGLLDLVGIAYLVDRWGGDAVAAESH
eukprot:COSAG05_NODE_5721_length_1107_cov_1.481151_1_plen_197_part_10